MLFKELYIKSIILTIYGLLTITAHAKDGRLYTSEQLSSSSVRNICQDRYGYIWIGTDFGLNRFDGYHFINYMHSRKDTTSIASNQITSILPDSKGRLWIGCGSGLARYNYATERFTRYHFPKDITPRVSAIVENKDGDVFFGTAGFGLFILQHGSDVIKPAVSFNANSDGFFSQMFLDSYGRLYASANDKCFYVFNINGNKAVSHQQIETSCGIPVAFAERDSVSLYVICQKGIMVYNRKNRKIAKASILLPEDETIPLSSAKILHAGTLLIGTKGNGVICVGKHQYTGVKTDFSAGQFKINNSSINYIFEDKDNNLWLSCSNKGIFLSNRQKSLFQNWSFSAQGQYIGNHVASIADDGLGGAWCAVREGSIYHFDSYGKITQKTDAPKGIGVLFRDPLERLWIGAGNSLYRFDPQTGHYLLEKTFTGSSIGYITGSSDGRLFVSVFGNGFYEYDPESGSTKSFSINTESKHGRLANDWVGSMLIDKEGLLWLSTSYGLSCMDISNYRFDTMGLKPLLQGLSCGPLCELEDGNIAVGTTEGLYLVNRHKKEAMPFPNAEILENSDICGIVCDNQGDLWISTTCGIWHYVSSKKCFISHIYGNGLVTREYAAGAVIHYSNGKTAFGHGDGITVFQPSDIKSTNMQTGQVFLTRFVCDGHPIDCHQSDFSIAYDKNTVQMEFSTMDFQDADHINFQYRINEGTWISTGEGVNTVTFSEMKPDIYRIEVRAERNGVYSEKMCRLTVRVLPPWYASTWAWLIYSLIAVLIIILTIRGYMRRKRAEMDEEKMKFLINATHDIRSPLTLIIGPLQKLKDKKLNELKSIEEFHDFNTSILQPSIKTMEHNAQRLMLLVNQILDNRKIDKQQMHLYCKETNLVEFVGSVCNLFKYNAEQRGITFTFEYENSNLTAWIDRTQFDKVVSNLLSNAFKYTFDGGEILVRLSQEHHKTGERAVLAVIDNGLGIKDDKPERLFERFYQGKANINLGIQGTGIGLNLSRSIVQMHGGIITASNRHDRQQGAVFTVSLPLGNKHLKPEEIVTEDNTRDFPVTPNAKKKNNRNFRIMVVDDDREVANYLIAELSAWYKFDYHANGKDALKTLLTTPNRYNLVISDVMMPIMDGIELLSQIKKNPLVNNLPVILLTSKTEIENKLEGLRYGADAYIAKPFVIEEVHIQIDNLLANVHRLRGKFSGAQSQDDKVRKIEVKGNDEALMERIMKSVNTHMQDPEYDVEALAQDIGVSRSQLHRKMKEMTGISTGQFLRNLRMEQAARILREGKIDVSQVAYSVGFTDANYFSTHFKKHFGVPPTEYVEQSNHP